MLQAGPVSVMTFIDVNSKISSELFNKKKSSWLYIWVMATGGIFECEGLESGYHSAGMRLCADVTEGWLLVMLCVPMVHPHTQA